METPPPTRPVVVRLLLARFIGDDVPVVVAAIDQTVWEHWDDADEEAWRKEGQQRWGMESTDCEWHEVWATFSSPALVTAFETPTVAGNVL